MDSTPLCISAPKIPRNATEAWLFSVPEHRHIHKKRTLAGPGGLDQSDIGPSSSATFAMISYTGSPTYRTNTVMEPIEEQMAKN